MAVSAIWVTVCFVFDKNHLFLFFWCRRVARALADALSTVSLVARFLVCGTAALGEKPKLLFSFGSKGSGAGQFRNCAPSRLACNPLDGTIWIGSDEKLQIFDLNGTLLTEVNLRELKICKEYDTVDGLAFAGKQSEVFVLTDC